MGDPEIETRISQYELAYRMQSSVPELMDIAREPQHVIDAYGADPSKPSVANQCLLARRLVERGVRFVQLNFGNWDAHQQIYKTMPGMCRQIDRPAAALVRDLKQRGLLDSTLIVVVGEFGRSPKINKMSGRDHWEHCYSALLAGGGIRGGRVVGASDAQGGHPHDLPVTPADVAASIHHALAITSEQLASLGVGLQGKVINELF